MSTPHDSWASVYDRIYEESFGAFYANLTRVTLETVQRVVPPPAKIADIGAGTGRLTIPLARKGYEVTAVEPSGEMLKALEQKLGVGSSLVRLVPSRMQDFEGHEEFDLVICVFTVLIYLLDESELRQALRAVARALKPSGRLFLDVPTKDLFRSSSYESDLCRREMTVTKTSQEDVFNYEEKSSIHIDGKTVEVRDHFKIRYWPLELVAAGLKAEGLVFERTFSEEFAGSGSNYQLWKKPANR